MDINIDRSRCEGHGICVGIVPDLVQVGDDGIAELLESAGGLSGPDDMKLAVDSCPAAAIRLA